MDKTIETMIDIAGRWESLDPLKDLNDTNRFIRQGQKDIQFLLDMIEAKDAEIDGLTEDVIGLKDDVIGLIQARDEQCN